MDLVEQNFPVSLLRDRSRLIYDGPTQVVRLESLGAKYALRMFKMDPSHEETFDLEDVLSQQKKSMEILEFLHNSKIPVSKPYKSKNNTFLIQIQRGDEILISSLLDYIEGDSPIPLSEKQQYQLGRLMAEFHNTMKQFMVKFPEFEYQKWDINDSLETYVKHFGKSQGYHKLVEVKEVFTNIYKIEKDLEQGIIHGDLHNRNLIMNQGVIYMLDFDGLTSNFLSFDLACFIGVERFLLIEKGIEVFPNYHELIRGYSSVRKLSEIEINLLPIFQSHKFLQLVGYWSWLIVSNSVDQEYKLKLERRIQKTIILLDELVKMWKENPKLYFDQDYMNKMHVNIFRV